MLLSSFLNLKHPGGIPTSGSLHLLFSLPGALPDLLPNCLIAVFPTQTSLLLVPSLALLVKVVTLPYCDPLCHHHFLFCSRHFSHLKILWSVILLIHLLSAPPPHWNIKPQDPPTFFPAPCHHLPPSLTPQRPHAFGNGWRAQRLRCRQEKRCLLLKASAKLQRAGGFGESPVGSCRIPIGGSRG